MASEGCAAQPEQLLLDCKVLSQSTWFSEGFFLGGSCLFGVFVGLFFGFLFGVLLFFGFFKM